MILIPTWIATADLQSDLDQKDFVYSKIEETDNDQTLKKNSIGVETDLNFTIKCYDTFYQA